MSFDHYIQSGGKRLRCGYTTGTCAALAAQGAARLLLTGQAPERVSLRTPKGWVVEVPVEDPRLEGGTAFCTVTKDGGDDMDVTHGLPIVARGPSAQHRASPSRAAREWGGSPVPAWTSRWESGPSTMCPGR